MENMPKPKIEERKMGGMADKIMVVKLAC